MEPLLTMEVSSRDQDVGEKSRRPRETQDKFTLKSNLRESIGWVFFTLGAEISIRNV